MTKKHHDFEKEILKGFENGEFVSVENINAEIKRAEQAANNFMKRDDLDLS